MSEYVEVSTQAELDKALKRKDVIPIVRGAGLFVVYGSSQVRAYGSSQVRAYGSSQVTAYGSSQVTAYGSSQVTASQYVAVTKHGGRTKIKGGVLIEIPPVKTAQDWLELYGIKPKRGVVTLYKGVDAEFASSHRTVYTPGTKPQAPDWDGGKRECGGGLHFSPTPGHTLQFAPDAKHFVGCPVKVADIVVHADAMYPSKVKAPGVCGPVFEVDINGERL